MMRAIVLATAGGRGLSGTASAKCLLKVRGRTLLERILTSVQYAGVHSAVCIVGDGADDVIESCRRFNPRLEIEFVYGAGVEQGDIASLNAAQAYLEQAVLILNANSMFPFPLLKRLVEVHSDNAVLFDSRLETREYPRVIVEDGHVVDFVPSGERRYPVSGASLELVKLGRAAAQAVRRMMMRETSRSIGPTLEHLYRQLAREHSMTALDTPQAPWRRIGSLADWNDLQDRAAHEIVVWEVAYARRST